MRFGLLRSERWPPTRLVPRSILHLSGLLISATRDFLRQPHPCFPASNLSREEFSELNRLTQDPDITIRKADKGGKWVVMKTAHYDNEALRQLNDSTFYQPCSSDSSKFLRQHLHAHLQTLYRRKFINKKELSFLSPVGSSDDRTFYHLPKLHKDAWPTLALPPGRPIVSDLKSLSYNCSKLLEHFLAPLVSRQNSYLRDTGHLIATLRDTSIRPNDLLFTMDIESLYSNIPLDEGIDVISQLFRENPNPRRPDLTLLSLLRLLLKHNAFSFKGTRWTQIKGVAMGKIFAGSLANLFLSVWETRCLSSAPRRPQVWKRFQDDVFGIWSGDATTLSQFHTHVNAQHASMKTSLSYGRSVNFLDLSVTNNYGSFSYKLFTKATDSNLLLPPSSYHPSHTALSVLYSQILRIASRCSDRQSFREALSWKSGFWRAQGYSRSLIRSTKQRVLSLTQQLDHWDTGTFHCGHLCSACPFLTPSLSIHDSATNNAYPIMSRITCLTTHVIYAARCSHGHIYVGQTERSLRERILQHVFAINNSPQTKFHRHFHECDSISNLRFIGIERVLDTTKRLMREQLWLHRLHASLNTQQHTNYNNKITLVLPFSKCATGLGDVIRNKCRDWSVPARVAFRKAQNLKERLARPARDVTTDTP